MAASALSALRTQAVAAASGFSDYNFRTYFVKHTAELYDTVATKPQSEIDAFLATEGPAHLARMKRMALINTMYAETPVIMDDKAPVSH